MFKKRSLKEEVVVLLGALSGLMVIFTWAGFLSRYDLFFDLLSHFRTQYVVLCGLCSVAYCLYRKFALSMLLFFHLVVNAAVVFDYFVPAALPKTMYGTTVRAMVFNVHQENTKKNNVIEYIRKEAPDVAVLIEVNQIWAGALKALGSEYPHSIITAQDDNFGIALFSKYPFVSHETVYLGVAGRPVVLAELELPFANMYVAGVHPFPPITRRLFEVRNQVLQELGEHLRKVSGPKLVLGDLNTTPWSAHYQDFVRAAGVQTAAAGFGIWRTWSGKIPAIFGIPIDHCLRSGEIAVLRSWVGPWLNSDHRPVLAELFIPAREGTELPTKELQSLSGSGS